MALPKYLDLANSLRGDIITGKYNLGQKLPSENELAKEFGLSRQTIRQTIDILSRENLLERKRGSGTYVTFGEYGKQKPTKVIGVISTYFDSYIFPAIINGIDEVLQANGYMMQLALTRNRVENETQALNTLLSKDVDGFIVEPTKSNLPNPNMMLYRQIERRGIPLVFFNSYYPDLEFPYICMNDRIVGYKAAKCLIDAGHKNIGGIFQSDDRQGKLRYQGFMEALSEAKLNIESSRIVWFSTEDLPFLAEDIARIKRALNGTTGLVCYNDQVALTLIPALIDAGYEIPGDLSIVSIDNNKMASFCEVPLTTLTHPMERLGQVAAESVLKLITNPKEQVTVEFDPELIIRESVKNLLDL